MKMSKPLIRFLIVACLAFATNGCTNLVFQPMQAHVMDPRKFGVVLDDVFFTGDDGISLHGWFLPAEKPKGTVVFLHGNAQNISTHIASVHWLPRNGYNVYLYDYRGYGKSGGRPDYDWTKRDLISAIRMLEKYPGSSGSPVVVFGQSLGGSIAISTLGGNPERFKLAALVTEGAPSSLRAVAREALGSSWLTWAFQYPLSFLISDDASPLEQVAWIAPIPLLIIHSKDDNVVTFQHGRRLYESARQPVQWLPVTGPHIGALSQAENQRRLVEFLDAAVARRR
jgi:uncharacterized protein